MTRPKRRSRARRLWKDAAEPALFTVVFTQFLGTMIGVSGASMMPNLHHGERVLIPKYETWLHRAGIGDFQRGDIVVFKPPAGPGSRVFFGRWTHRPFLIKRLVALPGDTVRIEGGVVHVNGERTAQGFITDYWRAQGCWDTTSELANRSDHTGTADGEAFTVPPGRYFLMGDNRTAGGSQDSRVFGPVPLHDIAGRAALVVWPVFRKVNARYDCSYPGPDPEGRVRYSGENELNVRLLRRPVHTEWVRQPGR